MSHPYDHSVTKYLVRPAVPADARRVSEVRVQGWREAYAGLLSAELLASLDPEAAIEGWRRTIEAAETTSFVAEVDGVARGFAIAGPPQDTTPPRDRQLWLIYQDSALHGSGSGQALLEAVLEDAPAYLWTAELNPRAIAFYRRNGFEADGSRVVQADLENLAELRMVR